MRVVTGPKWDVWCVVWDTDDWARLPVEIVDALIDLRRMLGKTSATKFDISMSRRG